MSGMVKSERRGGFVAFRHASIVSLFLTFLTGVGLLLSAGRVARVHANQSAVRGQTCSIGS